MRSSPALLPPACGRRPPPAVRPLQSRRWALGAALAVAWASPVVVQAAPAAPAPPRPIYSCVDAQGRRISADRPIPECLRQEQRLHNRDGSVRAVAPPLLSLEEQAQKDQARQQARQQAAAREEVARRDRLLLSRYPDEAAHAQARAATLAPAQRQVDEAQARLDGQATPGATEGTRQAQRQLLQDRLAERDRLQARLDAELARLRRLWAGAAPGSTPDGAASEPERP
jgi:hypothetical protein